MKVLFIGGTGIISSACSELALQRGIDLYLLNRGKSPRPAPTGAKVLHGDIREPGSVRQVLGELSFDSVVDWIAFLPEPAHVPARDREHNAAQPVLGIFTEESYLRGHSARGLPPEKLSRHHRAP